MASLSETLDLAFSEDDEERESTPMSDADHLRTFGWAWDDPNGQEEA